MNTALTKPRILIVDDTPLNLDILFGALQDRYTVIAARDGAKALELAQRDTAPDLILLDIMMPGMDGYEVCRRLKSQERTRSIPIIFLTALTDEGNELKGLELGAVDYIHKPISLALVQARVATQLELLAARRQLASQVEQLVDAARLRDEVDQITRHDLKSPLTPIIWFSRMMRGDANLTEQQRERMEVIHSSSMRMLEMINRSLDLYKMEMGSYRYLPVPVDLQQLVERVAVDYAEMGRAQEVEIACGGTTSPIMGDEMLCFSMLGNLLKNALEAAPAHSRVTFTLGEVGTFGVIQLHNSGAVPDSLRDRFFDKFVTAGKEGGTGLGTYSARLMADTMGGSIAMQSSDATGTTITVRLPLAHAPHG